jgi:hypothetical protein
MINYAITRSRRLIMVTKISAFRLSESDLLNLDEIARAHDFRSPVSESPNRSEAIRWLIDQELERIAPVKNQRNGPR